MKLYQKIHESKPKIHKYINATMSGVLHASTTQQWKPSLVEKKTTSPTRVGVQSSSNSNHRHPNLFCGKRAPQLVISTTLISNHCKILFSVI